MDERIEVFVNDAKVTVYRGLRVKHALIAYDQDVYRLAVAGSVRVYDRNGFAIGLDGALSDGARIYVRSAAGDVPK